MKIKGKLTLGTGVLFGLIAALAAISVIYIYALATDSKNVLVANYNTLEYSRNMLLALDDSSAAGQKQFEENLTKQKNNITEPGEGELTSKLGVDFAAYHKNRKNTTLEKTVRNDMYEIMRLNMVAIKSKSAVADDTANKGFLWISIASTVSFLIAFVLWFNLPGYIANPIKSLTQSIKQIAAKNYNERINFDGNDEFAELANAFNSMAEKLGEYENSNLAKLMFEKKRIETIINNMNDPVIGISEENKVLFANNEALKILGLKEPDLIGKYSQEVAGINDLFRSLIDSTINVKEPLKIYANGKESYFEKETIEINAYQNADENRPLGYVIVLKNITLFKELDFAKTNFIATVSHELKTPISAIKMSLQLLKAEKTGETNTEQKQLLESIADDTERLLKITGELLNLSAVETGNIQLNLQDAEPLQIVGYATEAVKVTAEQKNITLSVKAAVTLPLVKADAEKTAWVLINLLTNAIRYSPEYSEVVIELSQQDNKVLFTVKDTGKGIDVRYRERIFDRYFQVPGSNKTGTGLGLAISKEFIEAQGGSIGLESEIGMGSRFYFTLNRNL